MSTGAVILAGGNGTRFGAQKQFTVFIDKELWRWVADACKDSKIFDELIVVGVDIPGGQTRQESVFRGIRKLGTDKVVVLEAARPLITPEQIITIANVTTPSVSFAAKAKETVIYMNRHIDRTKCSVLQVPQAFDREMLLQAHTLTKEVDATDDTILMWECFGITPTLIPGGNNLHKVTYYHDLYILEKLHEGLNNGR